MLELDGGRPAAQTDACGRAEVQGRRKGVRAEVQQGNPVAGGEGPAVAGVEGPAAARSGTRRADGEIGSGMGKVARDGRRRKNRGEPFFLT